MLEFDVEWVGLADFPNINEVKEDGKTFAENARKKALGYAKATGLWTIADDSGLIIDALGGKPGVKSARFSGAKDKDRTLLDHKNMAKVLKLLEGVPKEKRTARFVCCLCLACPACPAKPCRLGRSGEPACTEQRRSVEGASPEKVLIETEGKLEGFIAVQKMGANGFGYDPIFFVPHLNKTVAQLTTEEKNAISHRGNALRKLKPLLTELLRGE
jgi:XTP/dITP diphosphohydrolase